MSGAYISYPFCTQKCTFCNFASDVYSRDIRERYEAALLDEIRAHRWRWQPETAYFGGGTPSLMADGLLRKLMDALPGVCLRETTLECAPGTITSDSARAWLACGINRVSLGVQSFVTKELRQVGRRHSAATVETEVKLLRDSNLSNINIDLIAGLPGQTWDSWEGSLDWIERLAPAHVSVYIFEVDEESRLGSEVILGGRRYGANRVPDDGLVAEFYERAVARLEVLGIRRYEISNFARPGCESRHNLKYWKLEPYAGFGLDAHSFDGVHRWSNSESIDAYLGKRPAERTLSNSSEEHFFIGLRLAEGIEPTPEEWRRFARPIEKWTSSGMLRKEGPRLRLDSKAVLVSNEILQDFIA